MYHRSRTLKLFGLAWGGACMAWLMAWGGEPAAAQAAQALSIHASTVYANQFDIQADTNYDLWPDLWQRSNSLLYPHYTQIAIGEEPTAEDGRCLSIALDGGGVRISSPEIPILPKFGYKLLARVRAEKLAHTTATIVVELQDSTGKRAQLETSDPIRSSGEWTEVAIGPFHAQQSNIDRAILIIDAPRGKRGDLQGRLDIDRILLERLPSMKLTTGRPCNVYDNYNDIEVECTLSGIRDKHTKLRFELLEAATDRVMPGKTETVPLVGREISEELPSTNARHVSSKHQLRGYEGTAVWRPAIDDYGFYKIRVEMLRDSNPGDATSGEGHVSDYDLQLEPQVLTLAVLPPLPSPAIGEFGWSLPTANRPLDFDALTRLLPNVGVHRVKMPVWYERGDRNRGEEIVRFAERLSSSGIELIGVLDNPLSGNYQFRDTSVPSSMANVLLADPSFWQPKYEHIMTRLSLRLRWWQLGTDGDTSFYGYPDLESKVQTIRQHLFRFGQDVKLGLGWRWPDPEAIEPWKAPSKNPAWDYEQMSIDTGLNSHQLDANLTKLERTPALRWVLINPEAKPHVATIDKASAALAGKPPGTSAVGKITSVSTGTSPVASAGTTPDPQQLHENRVRELVQQMVTAKMHGADGIFVANPFAGPHGLMNEDGTPGEMLLPWRTTATLLAGSTYLGRIQLPNDSHNEIFLGRDGNLVMIVWNDEPTTEKLYLGDDIQMVDAWGKQKSFGTDAQGRVELSVGRRPSFVMGLNRAIAEWRMSIAFDQVRIPSVFGRSHPNLVRGTNSFRQGITGKYSIHVPAASAEPSGSGNPTQRNEDWNILPHRGELAIGASQPFELPIRIELSEATYGPQPVRIDFVIDGDRRYTFSAWRQLYVGLGDIQIRILSKLDPQGALVVEQRMVNTGPELADFKCLLYAPPRRRKRTQVVMLGADGNTKVYKYPNGEELLGQVLKLRAEQIDGSRVLVYKFVAGGEAVTTTPVPPPVVSPPSDAVRVPATETATETAPPAPLSTPQDQTGSDSAAAADPPADESADQPAETTVASNNEPRLLPVAPVPTPSLPL